MSKKIFGIVVALAAFAAVGSASTVACSPDGTANVVGSTIDCGPFTFSNFTVQPSSGGSATISMTAFSGSYWDSLTGLAILKFQIGGTQGPLTDVLFGYEVTGPLVGIDLSNPLTSGDVNISEAICLQAFVNGVCNSMPTGLVGNNPLYAPPNTHVSNSFNETQTAFIEKDIQFGAEGHISDFTESHLSAVPEPMTLSMMGFGLLGLGLMRRRQTGKK